MFVRPTFYRWSQPVAPSTSSDIPDFGDEATLGLSLPFGNRESPPNSDGSGFDSFHQKSSTRTPECWPDEDLGFNSPSREIRGLDISVAEHQLDLGHTLSPPSWRGHVPEGPIGLLTNRGTPGIHSGESHNSIIQTGQTPANLHYGRISPIHSYPVSSPDAGISGSIMSPTVAAPEPCRQRPGRDEPAATGPTSASSTSTHNRKRKSGREASLQTPSRSDLIDCPVDEARKRALEKNRLAADKCRNIKKRRVTQLQVDIRAKEMEHASLVEQITCMNNEVQQLVDILIVHVNMDLCRSPEEIIKPLSLCPYSGEGTESLFGYTTPNN